MRDNGGITVRGIVLDVEHKQGVTTKGQAYSFHIVTMLTGKAVSEVRWPESVGSPPKADELIALEVGLDVYNGRLQIEGQRVVPSGVRAAAASA